MRDPLLIDEGEKRIPDEWRKKYLKRPVEQLPADVTKAFDKLFIVEREKDQLRAELEDVKGSFKTERLKTWILVGMVTAQGAVLGILVKWFLDHANGIIVR